MFYTREQVLGWMDYIRYNPWNRDRFLECFWPSQINSKEWLIDRVTQSGFFPNNVFIFGGWYGILAQMIATKNPHLPIVSIDIDPMCEVVGREIMRYHYSPYTQFVTDNMATFKYPTLPSLVINTSTEHVDQATYDAWWDNIPPGTQFIIQGNDFFNCPEHIRCANSLQQFVTMNRADTSDYLVVDTLNCGQFNRFMAIGRKQAA